MTLCIPNPFCTVVPAASSRIAPGPLVSAGVFRLASDPLFYADLTLLNIMGGSRYRITRASNGAELATGVVSGTALTDVTLTGLPVYSNPMLVNITVRKASAAPKYEPFDTAASISRSGAVSYISQIPDQIA